MKKKLRKVAFCLLILFSVPALANSMDPKRIEELLHTMNGTRVEFTVPAEDDADEPKKPAAEFRMD